MGRDAVTDDHAGTASVVVPFAAIVLAMLPAVLDQTMLSTGLPAVAGDLGQLSDERRELGVATATAGFFRALGGAIGAAVLGAVFAARAGASVTEDGAGLQGVVRDDVIDGVQVVFAVAAPLAALALLAVLALVEVPLKTAAGGSPPASRISGGRMPDRPGAARAQRDARALRGRSRAEHRHSQPRHLATSPT